MKEKNFSWLLVALLVFLIGLPILNDTGLLPVRVLRALTISWLLIIGVWSLRGFGGYFRLGIALAAAGVLLNLVNASANSEIASVGSLLALLVFLIVAIWCTLQNVVFGTEISANRLVGAISLYLMMGVTWAAAYTLIDFAMPGSFSGIAAVHGSGWNSDWLYFSFVTLTTLGYGDISPVSATARTAAYLEAVVGLFYIAILVAGLVSAYISDRQNRSSD